jgi:hypothetical protein
MKKRNTDLNVVNLVRKTIAVVTRETVTEGQKSGGRLKRPPRKSRKQLNLLLNYEV